MKSEIRNKLRERREEEIKEQQSNAIQALNKEGYEVTFGNIGKRTTYAFLSKGDQEIVGYTYIKDLKYKSDLVGQFKALQQAMARKTLLEQEAKEQEAPKA